MSEVATIVATKLHRPLPPGPCIPRERLAARLDAGLREGCRLTLVTGPAGFGKSTLVASWLEDVTMPWAWLSLDAADNQPRRFLRYLVAALRQIDPSLGAELLEQLAADPPAYDELLAALLNALAARERPCALVLDDGHHLKDPVVLEQLSFFLDHSPPTFHLVICSREDPPLPLARMRARRQLLELRQADLRCTVAEARLFLQAGMGLALDDPTVEALTQRTEGWIAGLQLAGLSLQQHPDPAGFVQTFTGSNRYILDYLLDEVYGGQPADVRELMLRSAILARFCAPLCDALLGSDAHRGRPAGGGAAPLLGRIERANLFLIPLDGERRWYRFHHLFADLLRHRLVVERGQEFASGLHRAASAWFEAQGLLPEAVEHALASGDWPFAAELVERHGVAMLERSEVHLLAAWCAAFPETFLRTRPRLCLLLAWTLVLDLRTDCRARVAALLGEAERRAPVDDPAAQAWLAGHAAGIRGHLMLVDPLVDPEALIAFSQRALELLPADAGSVRSVNAMRLAYGYLGLGDAARALAALDEAEQLALATGNAYAVVSCAFDRARVALHQGDLERALTRCAAGREQLATTLRHLAASLPAGACFDLIEGCVLLERDDTAGAERCLERSLRTIGGIQQFAVVGYPALAKLRAAEGDRAGFEMALRRLVRAWPNSAVWAEGLRCWYTLVLTPEDRDGRAAAERWRAANVPDLAAPPRLPGIGKSFDEARYGAWITWARISVALGHAVEALPLIERLLGYALDHGLGRRVIELRLARAAALDSLGERTEAGASLGAELGYGPVVGHEPRLAAAGNPGGAPRSHPAGSHPAAVYPDSPADLLSERELEVLRLLAEEPSYDAIARQLVVSPNTVKSHIKHIYGKLQASNRRQAIAHARSLGLVR
jgi:LuxR family transcriptional regulator, maltose regulon positive regulatory protein